MYTSVLQLIISINKSKFEKKFDFFKSLIATNIGTPDFEN